MAGNLISLRRRIKSVKNTQKLTKAMKTVAAAKLRRATGELKRSRAYREKITQLLQEAGAWAVLATLPEQSPKGTLAEPTQSPKGTLAKPTQPLLQSNEQGAVLLVVIASDKGLCGAFNSHVLRQGEARYRELAAAGREVFLITVGTKAGRHFSRRNLIPMKTYNGMLGRLQFEDAARLAADLQELFLSKAMHSVEFAFSEYISASTQQFSRRRLFPIEITAAPPAPRTRVHPSRYRPSSSREPRRSSRPCCRVTSRPSSTRSCCSRWRPSSWRA